MPLPVIAGSIGGVLLMVASSIVARVLVSLGFAVVSYIGISYALDYLKDLIMQSLAQMPAEVLQLLTLMRVGTAMSILVSALLANMTLNGLTAGGVFKKFIVT